MLRASIQVLEDFEEELGSEKMGNVNELKAWAEQVKKRVDTVAGLLTILEKQKWTWTTGSRDIILYKNTTKKEAQEELKKLKIPEGIIEFD